MQSPERSYPVNPEETLEKPPSLRLALVAFVVVALLLLAVVAGLLPRWRQTTILRAETKELAIHTVNVITPIPGQSPAGVALPAEIKAFQEAPIYSRADGYIRR